MGATVIYVALGVFAVVFVFVLALALTAAGADNASERLLAEYLSEQARTPESIAGVTIDARRLQTSEVATRLSRRRTSRQPSSA